MVEEIVASEPAKSSGVALNLSSGQPPLPIGAVETEDAPRFSCGSQEMDRVLGAGMVPGSVLLVVGDPGVGKSSLTLQVCANVSKAQGKVLYATGEESARQVKLRADRLNALHPNLYVLSETNVEVIERYALELKPVLLVVDSIQTVYKPDIPSAPGSVSQVRECAAHLLRLAKLNTICLALIGHVTKDGSLSGPRVLEHIVDTVLYLEGDRTAQYRILRAVKNRFGSTNEIGLFEMRDAGLVDVPEASALFLAERPTDVSGSIVVPTIEGTRPVLVEIQALVSPTAFGMPRRTADGIDLKQVQLIAAVLEKRVGLMLGASDIYVKIAGGLSVDEPAVDLGLAVAIASSFKDCNTAGQTVVFGEIGLAGEVRAVTLIDQRVREAEKLGFKRVVLPKSNLRSLSINTGLELVGVENVMEALGAALHG